MQTESLRKAKIGQRLAREQVAESGWTGTRASFAADKAKAEREVMADARSSGADYDPVLEGARGEVLGRPLRTMVWSAREGRFVWWRYDERRRKWEPQGVEGVAARKLRVELSDAHEGRSVEEILAAHLEVE